MCFLLGIVTDPARKVEDELMAFRYFARENRDGWGMGWYKEGFPVIYKRPTNAIKDVIFPRIASSVISKIVIAHLRAKTRGNARFVNTHPFSIEQYMFAHNGTVEKKKLEEMLTRKYKNLYGDTDSERLFHFLIQNMEKYGEVHGMRRALRKIDKRVKAGEMYASSVNFLLSDGNYLFAFAGWYKNRSRKLYYLIDEGIYPTVYVATFPIFDEERWTRMENGELLIVDSKTMDVKTTMIR